MQDDKGRRTEIGRSRVIDALAVAVLLGAVWTSWRAEVRMERQLADATAQIRSSEGDTGDGNPTIAAVAEVSRILSERIRRSEYASVMLALSVSILVARKFAARTAA